MTRKATNTDAERPRLVGAMVKSPVRLAIETLSKKHDRSVSYIASKVLELDPDMMKQYREALRAAEAA